MEAFAAIYMKIYVAKFYYNNLKNGIRCPCGARKDKTYDGISNFNAHIKTKIHKKWIEDLNLNKKNFHVLTYIFLKNRK